MAATQTPEALFSEHEIKAADGLTLAIKKWLPASGTARGHVLILHGYMDHGGRYREVAHALCAAGLGASALDFRGHGRSAGQRGRVDQFSDYLDDIGRALETLPTGPRFILAHSNGALVALDFVVNRAPSIAGLVVTNPYLAQTVPVTGLKLWVGLMAGKHFPAMVLPSGLDPAGISHDAAVVKAYKRDPLVFTTANAAWFRETRQAQARVRGYTKLDVPFLYVHSDADPIASPAANRDLAAQLQGSDKTVMVRRGEFHEVLNEIDRQALIGTICDWIIKHLER